MAITERELDDLYFLALRKLHDAVYSAAWHINAECSDDQNVVIVIGSEENLTRNVFMDKRASFPSAQLCAMLMLIAP